MGCNSEGPGGVCPIVCNAAGIGVATSPGIMILPAAVGLAREKGGSGTECLDKILGEVL